METSPALGPAGSQPGRLTSSVSPLWGGFQWTILGVFLNLSSLGPFFFFCCIMFWLERVNFHDPTCSSVDFCLYYLSVSGFPQNHHFCLYLFMGYSDILSSASVVRDLMTVKPPTVSPVLSALPFCLNFVRSSRHILCFVLLNSQLVKNEAEERETLLLSTFLSSFQCVLLLRTPRFFLIKSLFSLKNFLHHFSGCRSAGNTFIQL